jgi:aspartate aminotransferase-like enzyme
MSPGPTQVPEAALLALARQVTHHRTREARAVLAEVLDGLKYVLQTQNDVVVLTSSGTGAMEAAVVNTVPRGGKAIVLEAGAFARRWSDICRAMGIEVVALEIPWGEAVEPHDVAKLVAQHPDAAAVFGTLMESSTGVGHDVEAIGRALAGGQALWVVDGISGAGVMECRTDAWGIDVLVVGSQKSLMLPPGLAFLSVSEWAWRQIERVPSQSFYFDLRRYRKELHSDSSPSPQPSPKGRGSGPEQPADVPDTPFTPAHTLLAALAESLKLIRAQGIETIWQRGRLLSRATRAGVEAMGLGVFARRPAEGLTAVRFPQGIDGARFLRRLEERFGVKLAGGQGPLKGQICRIAHLGLIDELDILGTLAAMELVLAELKHPVTLGAAAAAASRVLAEA